MRAAGYVFAALVSSSSPSSSSSSSSSSIPRLASAAAVASGKAVSKLDSATYQEPREADYWGNGSDARPFQELRTTAAALTRELFDSWILDGKVFVVEDAGRDWPMAKWDCEYFRLDPTFKGAEMNQQYAAGGGAPFVGFSSDWLEKRTSSGAKDPQAPQVAPYYWGIKDVQHADAHRSPTWRRAMLKKVQEHVKLPDFMNPRNLGSFQRTPEFWFAGAGAGAKAHMDSHVQATVSLQLAGTKRWRLGFMSERRAPWLAMTYKDGDVYNEAEPWRPMFNITLRPGEALFFPPGFIHETLNVEDDQASCAASVTFQFSAPMAARLYRRFLPRVRRTADIHEAWPILERWASLGSSVARAGKTSRAARAEALGASGAGHRFRALDRDGSGALSVEELTGAFDPEEAQNLLGFHDLDSDGRITREEFAEVYALWSGTVHDVLEQTPKKYRRYQLEDMVGDFNIEDLPRATQRKLLELARAKEASDTQTGKESASKKAEL